MSCINRSIHYSTLIAAKLTLTLCITLLTACTQSPVKHAPSSSTQQDYDVSVSDSDKQRYRNAITELYNGNLESAKNQFIEFIQEKPNLAGAYSNLSLISYKLGDYQTALNYANQAIKRNARQAQAYHMRAQAYVKTGKINEAKADYLKALELKPDYILAHYNLALLYDIYLQEIELALKHYQSYTQLTDNKDKNTIDWISHLKGTLNNG